MAAKVFRPGEVVPESGVYRVSHMDHRADHDATLVKGESFPECSTCRGQTRFELVRAASRVGEDKDFQRRSSAT